MNILLIELTVALDALGTLDVVRLSTGRGYNHVTAPGHYEGAAGGVAWFEQSIVDDNGAILTGNTNAGNFTFPNTGKFDYLANVGFGFNCRMLIGDEFSPYNDFEEVFFGIAEGIEFPSNTEAQVKLRGAEYELNKPMLTATFAGTNDGSTIYTEGTATDIKGRLKPRLSGYQFNLSPVAVNGSLSIFGYSWKKDGSFAPTSFIGDFRDAGTIVPADAPVADLTALIAATPAAGRVVHCPTLSLLKTGSKPLSPTLDAATPEQFLRDVVPARLREAGVPDSRIGFASLTALGALGDYVVGEHVQNDVSYLQHIQTLLKSINATLLPDANNVFQAVRISSPAAEPLLTLKRLDGTKSGGDGVCDMISCARITPTDRTRGMPTSKVTLKYAQNATIQQGASIAGSVDPDKRERYGKDFLQLSKDRAGVLTQFPLAQQIEIESRLRDESAAQVMLGFYDNYYGTVSQFLQTTAKVTPAQARLWLAGSTIRIEDSRFGNASSRNYVTLSKQYNPLAGVLLATLRG